MGLLVLLGVVCSKCRLEWRFQHNCSFVEKTTNVSFILFRIRDLENFRDAAMLSLPKIELRSDFITEANFVISLKGTISCGRLWDG